MTATLATGLGASSRAAMTDRPILGLRQYVMKPGGRDVLIALFDRFLLDAQEQAGNAILGQFRDLDRPERFVWLRGFPDMSVRARSLDAFYTSVAWKRHREAANATMVDVADVLLLHPLSSDTALPARKRPQDESGNGAVRITIYGFAATTDTETVAAVANEIQSIGAQSVASYVTEASPNNYPRLPIREGENALVRIATFPTVARMDEDTARLANSSPTQTLMKRLRPKLVADPQVLRLTPTARSLLHG